MTTKNQIFTSVISGSPMITSEKLVGSENYLSWSASVELWFMGQGYEDHLVTQEADIPEAKGLYTNDIQRLYKVASAIVHLSQQDLDLSTYIGQIASLKEQFLTVMPLTPDVGAQQTQLDKFFMVLTLIGLRPDLESIRDQILGSSSVPSLDDVFARLLRISSTQTLTSDSASDSSVLVSQTTSRGGRSGTELHGRPPRTAHMAQSSDSLLPQPPSSSASQTSQASIASVAQPGNASACLTHTSSLGPWILDSGASDHLSGNKDLFSSITTTSDLPTVTLANGSQTVAKGIGLALPLPSLPLTSVLYTPECPFNLISISKITRTLNCSITFSDKFVTLQDRSTGKTIGIGRESQGLYHLTSDSSPAVCISTDAPLLIHNRLGHPSLSKFQKMVPRFSTLSSLPCESCQLGNILVSRSQSLNARIDILVETARTLLLHSHVPFRFWGDAVLTACYLINRMPSSVLHDQIPHSLLFPDQPLYFLPPRVFGCTCFVHILTPGQDKLSAKAMKCLFLGYSRLQKGYRCYSLETHRYFISADVTFFEDSPFFSTTSESLPVSEVLPIPIVSPPEAMPPRPLQVYHRRPRVVAPLPFPEAPADSLPIPSASPAPALPSPNDLPIAVRKGWRQAMVDEMAALHSNGTWDLLFYPLLLKAILKFMVLIYGDTFSPVAKIASVRLLLSMAAMGSLVLVCRLRRSLYGLKTISSSMCIYLVVYVDDIVITGSDQDGIQKLKQHLFTHFQTKDLAWKLKYFLGIEIAQSKFWCGPFPKEYALDILEETGMLDCKPVDTPMDPNVKLVPGQGGAFRRPREISTTRSTPGQGVLYENRGHTQVVGYTDADWAGSPTDRRSTSGYCVLLEELRFGKDEQMNSSVITRPHYILHPIQSFMKGPSILKLTVISLERRSHQDVLLQVLSFK
ncbi:Retrovirus-related Pol polyprotein from transposon TNT 1-94 [Vitis vinifera]|uniref:Retrovirus-related Pol polyprotein from transposon TNT 1-94 n=1 Tax=Vitis vinifera TaxID=29760 RepID=A0A438EVW7_VITVI|nr:Retrovirus-related Pol polyprotein from transposon TNT 1-94 [Vitis vinifera]